MSDTEDKRDETVVRALILWHRKAIGAKPENSAVSRVHPKGHGAPG